MEKVECCLLLRWKMFFLLLRRFVSLSSIKIHTKSEASHETLRVFAFCLLVDSEEYTIHRQFVWLSDSSLDVCLFMFFRV
jgi:hypothetical protein